jgi:hypothetical protein
MKLESLEKFKMQDNQLSSIFGGLTDTAKWIPTSKKTTNSNGCVETTSDSFNDSNGNGQYDAGESATACTSIDCP